MAEPTTTTTPSAGRAAFTFILILVAFDFLAFGIIAPVLPDLIRHHRLFRIRLGHHAIYFLAASWRVVGSLRPPAGDPYFVLWAGHRLRDHGTGPIASMVISWAHYFGHHHVECRHGVRLRYR